VIALRIHLDGSTAANGPLWVLPGSHRDGVLSDLEVDDRVVSARRRRAWRSAGRALPGGLELADA
jgi:ectoine hydroxylase-related dioxygenase (phytanoyl-CoA dioxygenase family)